MTDAPVLVDDVVAYFDAWNAPADARPDVVAATFTADAYYCDGAAEATGRDQIVAMMAGVMDQFEGSSFALASPVDTHHQQARFAWQMHGPDGEMIVEGIDAVRFSADGQLSPVLGCFGVELPAPASKSEAGAAVG